MSDERDMTDQPLLSPEQKRPTYASRLIGRLQFWKEARQAATHEASIFIWIPKNAGTSVYAMLRQNGLVKMKSPRAVRLYFGNGGRVTFGHISIASLIDHGLISREFVSRAFKFAFARDPYARAVSLFTYLSGPVLMNWREPPSFREFLQILADGHYDRVGLYNSRGLSHCNPQVEWLRDAWPDKVYKVEELSEFVADIRDRWGISQRDIPHLNRSNGNREVELTREEKALIEQIYAEDFEAFAYARR